MSKQNFTDQDRKEVAVVGNSIGADVQQYFKLQTTGAYGGAKMFKETPNRPRLMDALYEAVYDREIKIIFMICPFILDVADTQTFSKAYAAEVLERNNAYAYAEVERKAVELTRNVLKAARDQNKHIVYIPFPTKGKDKPVLVKEKQIKNSVELVERLQKEVKTTIRKCTYETTYGRPEALVVRWDEEDYKKDGLHMSKKGARKLAGRVLYALELAKVGCK